MSAQLPVEYVTAGTVAEALDLLADGDTRVVASGYSLIPLLKDGIEQPDRLVDISALGELRGISRQDEHIEIGALTTHDRIAADETVRSHARALADATDSVGDYMAKRQGTIGGNLVFASPKYDLPSAVLALDGTIVLRGPDGRRRVDADEWFRGPDDTALRSEELVTRVVVPDAHHSGYIRTSEYSGYALVSVAARLDMDGDTVERARVAVNGAKPFPIRLSGVEATLLGEQPSEAVVERAAATALDGVDAEELLANDAAAGEHRRRLVQSYCQRALERAT